MTLTVRFRVGAVMFLLLISCPLAAQSPPIAERSWDLGAWIAAATGEEHTNSFAEAQVLSAGIFAGKVLTGEIGHGWRRGRFEYGVSLIPLFVHYRPGRIYGGGFEPVVLRWNSNFQSGRIKPYVELAGGAVRTNANLPTGNTSDFNFSARGGGGIQISTAQWQSVEIGCRWFHISNANLGVQNPEFNGVQLSLGYHWFK
jgi:lipid A 3-O-deacylase